mmetsp:Transcript_15502/g.14852  ORF Transcript_15502/g.14852 Transcript_15502/m.14852 type:complete len:298 (+) Transcript_15502:209-1102(+)
MSGKSSLLGKNVHNSSSTQREESSNLDVVEKSNKKPKSKELKKEKILSKETDLEEGVEKKTTRIGKESKGKHAGKSKKDSSEPAVLRREYDENDDLLSDYTSDTTFFDFTDGKKSNSSNGNSKDDDEWTFTYYKSDGKVIILGEWMAKTKSHRYIVIGPDYLCVAITHVMIIVPSVFVSLYLLENLAEQIVYFILFGLCILGLTLVFTADPGLLRKFHHARTRHWTYCDHCESFRPPGTVHCSTCQVCVAGYDHHCPWTGKCVGHGNILYFKIFVISLSWLIIFDFVLIILKVANIT